MQGKFEDLTKATAAVHSELESSNGKSVVEYFQENQAQRAIAVKTLRKDDVAQRRARKRLKAMPTTGQDDV